MKFVTKYGPYVLLLIAIVSLILQYLSYQAATADCDCQSTTTTDIGSGPIV